MAHYKETEKGQKLFLTVNLSEQIVGGTYEYTLNRLIDEKLDLSIFDGKYKNVLTEAAAIEPGILLKIIMYCYSLGIISSKKIAKMSRENMAVKVLAENTEPHYTTISNSVSGMSGEIEKVFSEVLTVCGGMGLIKGKMFAIDGCRLPSNTSRGIWFYVSTSQIISILIILLVLIRFLTLYKKPPTVRMPMTLNAII